MRAEPAREREPDSPGYGATAPAARSAGERCAAAPRAAGRRPARGGAGDACRLEAARAADVHEGGAGGASRPHLLGPSASRHAGLREQLRALIGALREVPQLREALLELRRLPPPAARRRRMPRRIGVTRAPPGARGGATAGRVRRRSRSTTPTSPGRRQALTEAGEPTELALRTGLALRHILVDEFQDTSLAQFELLRQLTAAWEPGDGRTLFVVGDPMQSIYRFRDAEVGLVPQGAPRRHRRGCASRRCA